MLLLAENPANGQVPYLALLLLLQEEGKIIRQILSTAVRRSWRPRADRVIETAATPIGAVACAAAHARTVLIGGAAHVGATPVGARHVSTAHVRAAHVGAAHVGATHAGAHVRATQAGNFRWCSSKDLNPGRKKMLVLWFHQSSNRDNSTPEQRARYES